MSVRFSALTLAFVFIASALRAQSVEYAPGTTRYSVNTTAKGSQTTPMGNSDFELGVRQQVTLNIAKQAKDTMVATVTLDSIALSGGPAAGADVSSLLGSKFVSMVSPTGHVYSTKAPEGGNPLVSQLADGISRFLPAYRSNLKTGSTWSDTTSGKVTQQGMDVDRTVVSNFRVDGDTTIGGEKAFKISRATSVKAAGSGTLQSTPVSMESTSTSNGAFFLSSKGVFLGGSSNDDVNVKVTILAQGAEISMKQNAQTKIEPIR